MAGGVASLKHDDAIDTIKSVKWDGIVCSKLDDSIIEKIFSENWICVDWDMGRWWYW